MLTGTYWAALIALGGVKLLEDTIVRSLTVGKEDAKVN